MTPWFNASVAYQPNDPATAATNPVFTARFGFLPVYMSLVSFVCMILSFRTNVVFVLVHMLLVPAFACMAAFFFSIGEGHPDIFLQHTAGTFIFVGCMLGWYLFISIMLVAVDFPFSLPVEDLSTVFKGCSERRKED